MTNHRSARLGARTLLAIAMATLATAAIAAPTFAKEEHQPHHAQDQGKDKDHGRHNGEGNRDNDDRGSQRSDGSSAVDTSTTNVTVVVTVTAPQRPASATSPGGTGSSSGGTGSGGSGGTLICYVDVAGFVSPRLVRDPGAQYLPTSDPGDGTSWRLSAPDTDCGPSLAD